MGEEPGESLTVSRTIPAPRARVFKAWTTPSEVKKWWSLGEGWKTPKAEVDLRVGGKLSIANEPEGGGAVTITGEFVLVEPPNKLVYTWVFPGEKTEESLITHNLNLWPLIVLNAYLLPACSGRSDSTSFLKHLTQRETLSPELELPSICHSQREQSFDDSHHHV